VEITEAIYLAHDMINRAKSGDGVVDMVASMNIFSGGSHHKKVEDSMNKFKEYIPSEMKYNGVLETLKEHKEKPGVGEILDEVLKTYPHLKEK